MTKVLIVDDDIDHAESIGDVLEMRGHETQIATSGEEGLARFTGEEFDFVLLDVKLPGINGVDTFLQMKKARPLARVMMMTGYSVGELVAQAMEGGALGVLHKPFSAAQVLDMLSQLPAAGKLLLTDDDPDFVAAMVPMLEAAGYEVEVAASGAEALKRVESGGISCLLLDLHLPDISGAELQARLAASGQDVPIIVVTGGREEAEGNSRLRSETSAMLFKPFEPNALLNAIGSAVSPKRAD
ncbi:MAG TPA: response regulator [Stellaceae bacterium]|jgi:CheY-like chemotaxis protein|nr:response regulator [Stellaceae bacterium]